METRRDVGFKDGTHTFPQMILRRSLENAVRQMKVDAVSEDLIRQIKEELAYVSPRKISLVYFIADRNFQEEMDGTGVKGGKVSIPPLVFPLFLHFDIQRPSRAPRTASR